MDGVENKIVVVILKKIPVKQISGQAVGNDKRQADDPVGV